ncbi:hypothetical protein [Subtercola sp. RTI3]|uniref:hypothetical protein n=1 Tax=Subtercola sp. RTI3 TaxID=3048639 RepID=UPI002B23B009|nr:hypothetical protein [Subtercola sp. RTI3]MEA9984912.1 hypothetical protein [Subtercola sp. RTI3]
MSTPGHPPARRRPSAKVYRRRRLVALVGVIIVIVAVVLIIRAVASGATSPTAAPGSTAAAGASDAPQQGPAASTSATPAPADPPATAAAPDPAATPAAPAATSTADGSAACAAGNITVTAVTDSNSYSAGSQPKLSFTIVNTGADPCTINAGTSKQIYTITSGTEVYWKSTDCQTDASDTAAMLAPGQTVSSTPFAWNRARSSPSTCGASAPASVPAGGASYHLTVSVDGIASAASAQFLLY